MGNSSSKSQEESKTTQTSTSEPSTNETSTLMPSFFIGHGSPTIVIDDDAFPKFLTKFAKKIPTPKAIVLFSAHWDKEVQTISCVNGEYKMIYDFGGFPKEMFSMVYPAKGNPELAEEIQGLLKQNKIECSLDKKRGIDHGTWTVLKLAYPKADIPLVQMSINGSGKIEDLYNIGKALAPLREKGVLILGSGATSHNLGAANFYGKFGKVDKWASDFENWIEKETTAWNTSNIFNYRKLAPGANQAVPYADHFVPYVIAMGSGDKNKKATLEYKEFHFGNLSYTVWRFD